jgi:dephospho-CoA kinase
MYVIGLTGNIATGKSTIAEMLSRLGACVIDADKLAHEAMRADTEVNQHIVARFGIEVRSASGDIDRARLAALVFSDAQALQELERIVHPAVVDETLRRLRACDKPVAVVEAIKLLEAHMQRYCQAIWVVTSSRTQQIERLVRTRSYDVAQAELRIDAQPPAEEKVARADVVIDNGRSLEETWRQVLRAWNAIPNIPRYPDDTPWEG